MAGRDAHAVACLARALSYEVVRSSRNERGGRQAQAAQSLGRHMPPDKLGGMERGWPCQWTAPMQAPCRACVRYR
ncbi:MAG: hypothetical protein WDW38_005430 [Sanguina aurantia]